jgi:hypothetical protein
VTALSSNALDVAQLVVSALTPLMLFVLGLMVTRATRRFEQAEWANRKVVERKLTLYEDMSPLINDLYCFFNLVGHFQEVTPPDAVSRKRTLDRLFYTHAPLFGQEFKDRYQSFMNACFQVFSAVAQDAKLKASIDAQRRERTRWDPDWDAMFAREMETSRDEFAKAHDELMETFAGEVGARL